ncbi:CoA pyrophosphatase [Flavobacteriaceae bacterium]|nr:CoA pyrophosphatase [Flavobacteriaceae bacterium]
MTFSTFNEQIVKITKLDLPGEASHHKMAPIERLEELTKQSLKKNKAKRAAVMALFYPNRDGETHLALILRKTYKGVHSAQVGFPGGKQESSDISAEHTALRETQEEIGVLQQDITVLKKLTQIYIPPSNFFVAPFIGVCETTPQFILQESEVEALIEVKISDFLDDSIYCTRRLSTSYATDIEVPAYILNTHVVWGATAMMLSEVRELLKQLYNH